MNRRESAAARPSVPRLRRSLLSWYGRTGRDLPWRRTCDPYGVWISEIMLQQTTVAAVIPFYQRFLSKYPDVRSLARSREDELLAIWSGLGYYRRARNLRAAARVIVQMHAGRLPSQPASLQALPGIGRYTAGAIASICFSAQTPAVDGNAARVISRLHALAAPPASTLWEIAERLVPQTAPGEWTQALMELGATVCRPVAPACGICPVSRDCRAFSKGDPERYAVPRARPSPVPVHASLAIIWRRGKILLVRRDAQELLGGLWELPGTLAGALDQTGPATSGDHPRLTSVASPNSPDTGAERRFELGGSRLREGTTPVSPKQRTAKRTSQRERTAVPGRESSKTRMPAGIEDPARQEILNTLRRSFALEPRGLERAGRVRHAVTRHRIEIEAWRGEAPRPLPPALRLAHGPGHLWADPGQLASLPIGSASRKVIGVALDEPARGPAVPFKSRPPAVRPDRHPPNPGREPALP